MLSASNFLKPKKVTDVGKPTAPAAPTAAPQVTKNENKPNDIPQVHTDYNVNLGVPANIQGNGLATDAVNNTQKKSQKEAVENAKLEQLANKGISTSANGYMPLYVNWVF